MDSATPQPILFSPVPSALEAMGDPTPIELPLCIPVKAQPWAHVLNNLMCDGVPGIARAIHARSDEELDQMVVDLAFWIWTLPYALEQLGIPGAEPTVLMMVFDLAQNELARRRAPKPEPKGNWIADTKAANRVEDVAARFTQLRPAGANRLKGLCPMHQEKTPSFLIWVDDQKWRCFGGCARGGDVLDLAERLGLRL